MKLCLLVAVLLVTVTVVSCGNVSYDGRSLIIDGQRKLLISASIHYPRSVPAMWPGLVQTAKEGGVDVIETYVFWNGHELSPGNYYFGGRFDLVKFARTVQQAGMFLILRIGPFVAAEWNFGGVPVWLHYVPGTVFRTYNQPFMYHMQKFTTYIVNLMKQEKLFASQGGPIILAQIENEYGYYENFYKEDGKKYALWAAKMAVSQNTGVPWIMCQQWDAPDPVIDTCNSFYCDQFKPTSPNRPKIWTENWPGWFKTFGGRDPHRPAEDVAFSVARFFQKGGSVHNYYMYHGGTNFGRTAGGPFITTSYDYDAPIDEYGLPRLPKWRHLKELHRAIKLCEHVLFNGKPVNVSLGPSVEADLYTDSSGACAIFISNSDDKNDRTVEFWNTSYYLPAWSVTILPDCKNVVFNAAKVNSQTNVVAMIPGSLQQSNKGVNPLIWDIVKEKPGIWGTTNKRTDAGGNILGCFCFLQVVMPDLNQSSEEHKPIGRENISESKELAYILQEIETVTLAWSLSQAEFVEGETEESDLIPNKEGLAKRKELLEALKDIKDHLLRAYSFGKEVTRMWEVNRIKEEWKILEEDLPPPKPLDQNLEGATWKRALPQITVP